MNKESSQTNMNQTQIVRSYVRGAIDKSSSEHDNTINILTARIVVIALAVILWKVTVPALMFVGAAYGLKSIIQSNPRMEAVEAVTAPQNAPEVPTKKRHYARRLKVTDFQTGKTIRV